MPPWPISAVDRVRAESPLPARLGGSDRTNGSAWREQGNLFFYESFEVEDITSRYDLVAARSGSLGSSGSRSQTWRVRQASRSRTSSRSVPISSPGLLERSFAGGATLAAAPGTQCGRHPLNRSSSRR